MLVSLLSRGMADGRCSVNAAVLGIMCVVQEVRLLTHNTGCVVSVTQGVKLYGSFVNAQHFPQSPHLSTGSSSWATCSSCWPCLQGSSL